MPLRERQEVQEMLWQLTAGPFSDSYPSPSRVCFRAERTHLRKPLGAKRRNIAAVYSLVFAPWTTMVRRTSRTYENCGFRTMAIAVPN